MNKQNTIIIAIIAAAVLLIVIFIGYSNMPKKVVYEYEPVQIEDIAQIRECVGRITGSTKIDVEELVKDQILLSDVYRYCLKTVDDVEAVLKELAK